MDPMNPSDWFGLNTEATNAMLRALAERNAGASRVNMDRALSVPLPETHLPPATTRVVRVLPQCRIQPKRLVLDDAISSKVVIRANRLRRRAAAEGAAPGRVLLAHASP